MVRAARAQKLHDAKLAEDKDGNAALAQAWNAERRHRGDEVGHHSTDDFCPRMFSTGGIARMGWNQVNASRTLRVGIDGTAML